jgi:hypothetical protein
MMSDLRSLLDRADRAVSRVPLADDGLEGLRNRRDHRRRNQRITAGVVGIAVFAAAIWVVTSGAPSGPRRTPGGTSPTPAPTFPGRVGLIGIAPKGATPSSPSTGELVLAFTFGHTGGDSGRFRVYVYADGRLISERLGDPSGKGDATGLIEQRLTAEGVELVRSEVLSTGLFDHGTTRHFVSAHGLYFGQIEVRHDDRLFSVTWGDIHPQDEPMTVPTPEQASALERLDARLGDLAWLPASAWEDAELKAFVPSRYMVCLERETMLEVELAAVQASLPRPAEDMVRTWDWTASQLNGYFLWCSPAITEEARALARSVKDAANVDLVSRDVFGLVYLLPQRDPSTRDVWVSFAPMLPHDP